MPAQRDFSSYFKAVQDTAPQQFESKPKIKYKVEDTFKPTFKNGKAEVTMRFLPSCPTEFKPFIENRSHMYEYEEGKFFGCDCLEKYGQSCPICDHNHKLYTCGKYTKETARPERLPNARRRFVANVYIVKNDNAPSTEGHVYRYEFGVQIMDMIRTAMQGYTDPEDGEVEGYNPFDYKLGANFIYQGTQGAMGPDIKKSKFGKRRPISDKTGKALTEAEIDEIEKQLYTLDEYERKVDQSWTYDEIVRRFKAKVGWGLFDKFKGTKEEVPDVAADVVPAQRKAANAAEAVMEAVDVDDEDTGSAVTATDEPTEETESSFFDDLEKQTA